jgi:hypothetical protein
MLTALLGSTGVVDLARSEFDARQQELKHPPPQSRWVELAIEPVRPVSSPTDTAVSIEDLYQSAAPDVQGLLQAMRGQVSPPRRLDVQRVQGAQWISYVYSEWNDHYRDELAKVWDCSPHTSCTHIRPTSSNSFDSGQLCRQMLSGDLCVVVGLHVDEEHVT